MKYTCRNCEQGFDYGNYCPWCGTPLALETKKQLVNRIFVVLVCVLFSLFCSIFMAPRKTEYFDHLLSYITSFAGCILYAGISLAVSFGVSHILADRLWDSDSRVFKIILLAILIGCVFLFSTCSYRG